MIQSVIKKDRERIFKGKSTCLSDLPEHKQNIFKEIKKLIHEFYGKEIDVYFFGSHKNGWWDELSDYDIMISDKYMNEDIKNFLESKLKLKIDIFFTSYFQNAILF